MGLAISPSAMPELLTDLRDKAHKQDEIIQDLLAILRSRRKVMATTDLGHDSGDEDDLHRLDGMAVNLCERVYAANGDMVSVLERFPIAAVRPRFVSSMPVVDPPAHD